MQRRSICTKKEEDNKMYLYLLIQKASGRINQRPMRLAPTEGMEGGWKNDWMRTEGTIPKDNGCLDLAQITVLLTESE